MPRLTTLALTFLVASTLAPLEARADAYDAFLQRLERVLKSSSRGGFTTSEVANIKKHLSTRPAGVYPNAYRRYIHIVEKTERNLRRGGFTNTDVEVMAALAQAKPDLAGGVQSDSVDYEIYVNMLAGSLDDLAKGGFISAEHEVVLHLLKLAPPREFVQAAYDRAYRLWSARLTKLDRDFQRGGLNNPEKQVLDQFRSVEPRLAGGAPPPAGGPHAGLTPVGPGSINPAPPPTNPPPPPPPRGGPFTRNFCRQDFVATKEMSRPQASGPALNALVLSGDSALVEIDAAQCRIRWITDAATDIATLGLPGYYVVVRQTRQAYLVDPQGDVFLIATNMTGVEVPPQTRNPKFFQLRDAAGRMHSVEITGTVRPGLSRLTMNLDGQQRFTPKLYAPAWRPLPEPKL